MKSVFQNSKTASPALPKSLWVFIVMLSFVFGSYAQSDGPKILFSSTRDGNPEIYTMNLDGSNVVNLSQHPRADRSLTWSPDGKKIGFTSTRDRDGNTEVFVMDADGGNPTQLTHTPFHVYNTGFVWSPDGTKIAFSSIREGKQDVYVMNADSDNLINLTRHPAADVPSSWSPDGTKILFTSNRDGNTEIYVMNRNGKGVVRLTHNPAPDNFASWFDPRFPVAAQKRLLTLWATLKRKP